MRARGPGEVQIREMRGEVILEMSSSQKNNHFRKFLRFFLLFLASQRVRGAQLLAARSARRKHWRACTPRGTTV